MGSGSLIYGLAGSLCALFMAETLLIAYNFRFQSENPASSKLVFYAEAGKLLLAACCFMMESQENAPGNMYRRMSRAAEVLLKSNYCFQRPTLYRWCEFRPEGLLQMGTLRADMWSWLKAMAVFSVPAACYFMTNNLCFYALQLMPAHTYTLLSDLKVITTGVLSYLLLDKQLNQQAAASLVLLFCGICLGEAGTTAGPGSNSKSMDTAFPWVHGLLVMMVVAMLSASAAVYTEWLMNHSAAHKHESINLQNMRMYASGTLFNGIYCVTKTQGSLASVADMRTSHWIIVVQLAFTGLITAVIIKRFGNIVKIYSSCIASLCSAGASSFILHDPPRAVFYLGCMMAMTATLQLQRAHSQASKSSDDHEVIIRIVKANGDKGVDPFIHMANNRQHAGLKVVFEQSSWAVAVTISLILLLLLACYVTQPVHQTTFATTIQPVNMKG